MLSDRLLEIQKLKLAYITEHFIVVWSQEHRR